MSSNLLQGVDGSASRRWTMAGAAPSFQNDAAHLPVDLQPLANAASDIAATARRAKGDFPRLAKGRSGALLDEIAEQVDRCAACIQALIDHGRCSVEAISAIRIRAILGLRTPEVSGMQPEPLLTLSRDITYSEQTVRSGRSVAAASGDTVVAEVLDHIACAYERMLWLLETRQW